MLTDEELELGGLRYEDLQEMRIVSNRTDLLRKQTLLGFPRAIKTGQSQAMFLKSEVFAWLRERAAQREALPPALPDGMKRKVGRPPKTEYAPPAGAEPAPVAHVKPKMKRAAADAGENAGAG